MFHFLGSASKSYIKHFQKALHVVCNRTIDSKYADSVQGPTLCIFHETRNTEPLGSCMFLLNLTNLHIKNIDIKYCVSKIMVKMSQSKYEIDFMSYNLMLMDLHLFVM